MYCYSSIVNSYMYIAVLRNRSQIELWKTKRRSRPLILVRAVICVCSQLGHAVALASRVRIKRVSQSAFHSDPQNIQLGKASLIEHLFGTVTTDVVRKVKYGKGEWKETTRRCMRKRRCEGGGKVCTGCDHQSDPYPVKRLTSRSQTSQSNAAE